MPVVTISTFFLLLIPFSSFAFPGSRLYKPTISDKAQEVERKEFVKTEKMSVRYNGTKKRPPYKRRPMRNFYRSKVG